MSIKLMAQVWERKLSKAEQSVLLAMADHAQDDGSRCYPSVDWIAWKTDYSTRQVQRTIKGLCATGALVKVRGYGRGRPVEYCIDLSKTEAKPEYVPKGDAMSRYQKGDMVSLQSINSDTTSPQALKGDMVSPQNDPPDTLKGDISSQKGDICDVKGDIAMSPEPIEPLEEPLREEEKTHARDPLTVAWQQAYADVEMPPKLATSLKELAAECSIAAAIHGIKASAAKPDGRNFKYIAECARNYVPPAPSNGYATGPSYLVDIPGVVNMAPATNGHAPPPLPPPLEHDDPWAIALAELSGSLPGSAPHWLEGSRLEASGELAGEPLYRVILTNPRANAQWLTQQAEPAVRKKLASLLRKRILLEFVEATREAA